MKQFKGKQWMVKAASRLKEMKDWKPLQKIRLPDLKFQGKRIAQQLQKTPEQVRQISTKITKLSGKLSRQFINQTSKLTEKTSEITAKTAQFIRKTPEWPQLYKAFSKQLSNRPEVKWIKRHRIGLISSLGAVILCLSITFAGNYYVSANTNEVFHVFFNGNEVGTVSDPGIVEDFIKEKERELQESFPHTQIVLEIDDIAFQPERAFKATSDDEATLVKMEEMLGYHAVGVEILVDGESMGIVKDEETASGILRYIQEPYTKADVLKKAVSIAADGEGSPEAEHLKVESVGFVNDVKMKFVKIDPSDVMEPREVAAKLQEGEVVGMTYTIEPGDCVTCIAAKLGISTEYIYQKNPHVKDSLLQIGDTLDLTEVVPKLSVKTVLQREEVQEVHYTTKYIDDASLRKGTQVVDQYGKEGKKLVTYRVTQINGVDKEMEIIEEEMLIEPVPAIVRRGTKIVSGYGTGSFAWPVVNARISSGYGKRSDGHHGGLDLVSRNRNILASDNGKVEFAGYKSGYGNCIIINHNNGYKTLYAHLSKILVKKGANVQKGDKIGIMGTTGNSTGVHLHFEIYENGKRVNPLKYL